MDESFDENDLLDISTSYHEAMHSKQYGDMFAYFLSRGKEKEFYDYFSGKQMKFNPEFEAGATSAQIEILDLSLDGMLEKPDIYVDELSKKLRARPEQKGHVAEIADLALRLYSEGPLRPHEVPTSFMDEIIRRYGKRGELYMFTNDARIVPYERRGNYRRTQ